MPTAHTSPPTALTVLVDDVRGFKDERPALVARSSREALTLLEGLGDRRIDHLWLDHDLGGEDSICPVIVLLVQARKGVTAERGTGPHSHSQRRCRSLEARARGSRVRRVQDIEGGLDVGAVAGQLQDVGGVDLCHRGVLQHLQKPQGTDHIVGLSPA